MAIILFSICAVLLLFGVSAFAARCGFSLVSYWAMPLGAAVPWLFLLTGLVLIGTNEADPSRRQAVAMAGLFPLGALAVLFTVSLVLGLFVSRSGSPANRFLWGCGVSAIPAVGMSAWLLRAIFSGN